MARFGALTVLACALGASPAWAGGGGAGYVDVPAVTALKCLKQCDAKGRVHSGGILRVKGRNLATAQKVVFLGGPGGSDDVEASPNAAGPASVLVTVPFKAPSGPVAVAAGDLARSAPSKVAVSVLPAAPPAPQPQLTPVPGLRDAGAPQVETGTSEPTWFYGSAHGVIFSYRLSAPAAVRIDLLKASDGSVVQSWAPGPPPAGQVQSVEWKGEPVPGQPAPEGRYAFRLTAQTTAGATARSAQMADLQRDAFDLFHNRFPIAGRHSYGLGAGRFGAGRGGRSHQGQDVFAKCGTPLVASRGGVVTFSKFQSLAGNYIVINGDGTDVDHMYAHLRSPSPFKTGDRVPTGQEIGQVGDTGDAQGCHLHMELWKGAYQQGGSPFDPLPELKAWDQVS